MHRHWAPCKACIFRCWCQVKLLETFVEFFSHFIVLLCTPQILAHARQNPLRKFRLKKQ
jgi:hypothetical protein